MTTEHILFLTGKLAQKSLHRVLEDMQPAPFTWQVHELGLSVAGLMTADMIRRRLPDAMGADRILVPGRCRGDLDAVAAQFGVPVQRGPDELKDLPAFFGRGGRPVDLSQHDVRIFAEIVDAATLDVPGILQRASAFAADGADVIDLGCLPDTPFDHLEDAIAALKATGYAVSVDSLDPAELVRAGRAGADFLLSLKEDTLWVAEEVASVPVLIPATPGDLDSLERAMAALTARGRAWYADPILEPIHFGFTDSLVRYHEMRRRHPDAPMLMGVGNLTELTDADTMGVNALLLGIVSELRIGAILATQVSPHARSAIREAALARRIMYAARERHALPRGLHEGMMALHGRRPFPDTPAEIDALAAAVRDPNFRVQVSTAGIHVYNRDGMRMGREPFEFWPHLGLEGDAGHAFYMGVELARAHVAAQLGKRYTQDQALEWGAATAAEDEDLSRQTAIGTTLSHRLRDGKR